MTNQPTELEQMRRLAAGVFYDLLDALEDTVLLEVAPVDGLAGAVQVHAPILYRAGVIDSEDAVRADKAVDSALRLLHEWDGAGND